DEFRNYVEAIKGQNINNLTRDYLLNYKIPLPEASALDAITKSNNKVNKLEEEILKQVAHTEKEISRLLDQSLVGPLMPLGRFITFEYGKGLPERERVSGDFPVVGSNGVVGYHDEFLVKGPVVVVGRKGSVGKVNLINNSCYPIDTTYFVRFDEPQLNPKY